MSANTLYVGRDQDWLQATWRQYLLDTGAHTNPDFKSDFETFIAAWQARMPDSGSGINGTGLTPALTRIARQHVFQFFGTNTMAKHYLDKWTRPSLRTRPPMERSKMACQGIPTWHTIPPAPQSLSPSNNG